MPVMKKVLNDIISFEKTNNIKEATHFRNELLAGLLLNVVKINDILNELNISKKSQKEILAFLKDFKPFLDNDIDYFRSNLKEIKVLLNDLERFANRWDDRVFVELEQIPIIIPFLDGNLNTKKLLNGPEEFFQQNPSIWNNLPTIQKEDLQDFIKCYLNQAWTSAGIMAMRVIESAVRDYYKKITNSELSNWYDILANLKGKYPNANKNLIKRLDYIRKNVRNPLAHPELRIGFQEAEECFQQALYILPLIYK